MENKDKSPYEFRLPGATTVYEIGLAGGGASVGIRFKEPIIVSADETVEVAFARRIVELENQIEEIDKISKDSNLSWQNKHIYIWNILRGQVLLKFVPQEPPGYQPTDSQF